MSTADTGDEPELASRFDSILERLRGPKPRPMSLVELEAISPDGAVWLDRWLARLCRGSSGFVGLADRDGVFAEMRTWGEDRVFPLLAARLARTDPHSSAAEFEIGCEVGEAMVRLDLERGMVLVLPWLASPDDHLRWVLCRCLLRRWATPAAIEVLLRLLRSDPSAAVRAEAAGVLGIHGGLGVIPALLDTLATDHEEADDGHTPSGSAALALNDLLKTTETRIKLPNGLCQMTEGEPDLEFLRQRAEEVHRRWQAGST